jgi:hypothetical protein
LQCISVERADTPPRGHTVVTAMATLRINELIRGRQQRRCEHGQAAATWVVVDALTESLLQSIGVGVYTATVSQVRRLDDALDAETTLAWANEVSPDDVPSVETWAHPERPA